MPDPITISSLGIVSILALLKAVKKFSSRLESSSCTTKDMKVEIKTNDHISDSETDEPEDSPPPQKKRGRSKSR